MEAVTRFPLALMPFPPLYHSDGANLGKTAQLMVAVWQLEEEIGWFQAAAGGLVDPMVHALPPRLPRKGALAMGNLVF